MDSPLTISGRQKPACQTKHLTIGCLIFPRMDQIDFTGPFEVLARIPDSTMRVIAKTRNPVRDMQGLILTPEVTIAEAPELDTLKARKAVGTAIQSEVVLATAGVGGISSRRKEKYRCSK